MYKTIVCAIEASLEGKVVLSKAVEIGNKFGSRVIVISVLPYSFLPKDYQKELKESTSPKLDKIISEFGIAEKNRVIKVGKPYEAICKEAEKRKADLIVLGTHSQKGINSVIGSTASSVVSYAKCDVSLVKV